MARETTPEKLEEGIGLGTDQRHDLVIHRNYAEVIELEGAHFVDGGHVMLPVSAAPEAAGAGAPALATLAFALGYAAEHDDRVLLIAAHDDGPDAKVSTLVSQRRADNVHALLKGDRDAFVESCAGCDITSVQLLLRWACVNHGIACSPGTVSGVNDAATRRALRAFREATQAAAEPGAEAEVVPLPGDFGAFFDLYQTSLAKLLEVEEADLPDAYGKIAFEAPERIGCGNLWGRPIGADALHYRSPTMRRVDLVFFETGEPIPKLEGEEPAGVRLYENDLRARKIYIEPDAPPGGFVFSV